MLLKSLEVHNWRNLKGKVEWNDNLNIIYGENGQGKTNLLEAIYLLATTKSFRTQRLQEALLFDEQLGVVRGRVTRTSEVSRDLQVTIQGQTKQQLINGKREPVTRYLNQLHAVAFTADELEVVRGGPDARRKFIDRGVTSLQIAYLHTLADYNRILKQKNRLLQDAADWDQEEAARQIQPWNNQLITLGAEIHRARVAYVEKLNEALERRLFQREEVTTRYVSSLEGKGDLNDYESLLAERLDVRLSAEIASGYSLIGPHRDDLEILFDGRNIRAFGSSGQQRSALIILDLAVISVYHTWHKEHPIYLVDDIDAELDRNRLNLLLDHLQGRVQTFITTSKMSLVEQYAPSASIYEVVAGNVIPGSSAQTRSRDSEAPHGI